MTAYAVEPTKLVCGLGTWNCKPTFSVRKSKGVSLKFGYYRNENSKLSSNFLVRLRNMFYLVKNLPPGKKSELECLLHQPVTFSITEAI